MILKKENKIRRGENHPRWKGKNLDHSTYHDWLYRYYGKPLYCEHCFQKDKKKYEWCLKKGCQHEHKRENYIRLCTSCHRKYDWTEEKSKQCSDRNKGKGNPMYGKKRIFSEEHIKKIKEGQLRYKLNKLKLC